MKKFKIISTCASLVLMLAMLAFGVYAASTKVSFSVTGTVSFKCENVFIKVAAGIGDQVPTDATYYYSKPATGETSLTELKTLENQKFKDEKENGNVLKYYLEITNLHSMDINLMLGYEWTGTSKYNTDNLSQDGAVSVTATYKNKEGSNSTESSITAQNKTGYPKAGRTDALVGTTSNLTFKANSTTLMVVTLTLKDEAMVYVLSNASITLKFNASLAPITDIDQKETTQG